MSPQSIDKAVVVAGATFASLPREAVPMPSAKSFEASFELEETSNRPQHQHSTRNHHPRSGMSERKWKGTVIVICFTSMINGYDVSNIANIQPRLYEALGSIELLSWISLSYSLAVFSALSLARKIIYCANLRWIYLSSLAVFIIGAGVSGAAVNVSTVIVGRCIMGAGGAIIQQTNMCYLALFATAAETHKLVAYMSAAWAVGLVVGGPISSAISQHWTWRWSFYFNIPLVAFAAALAMLCIPRHSLFTVGATVWKRVLHIDPVGILFNIVVPVLFTIGLTFPDPIWDWGSSSSVAVWVFFGLTLVGWITQQYFCILTSVEERALPIHILPRLDLVPIWIASACAGAAYSITLYYTPLYFAFAHGADALEQTARVLPFTLVFIITLMFTGYLLPVVGRYDLFYIAAGIVTVGGSAAMAATLSDATASSTRVMVWEALIGMGLGLHFQHGMGISNIINKSQRDRVDSAVVCNLAQMGGIVVTLAMAGSIFQNVGYKLLVDAVGDREISERDLREALAGVSSTAWQDPEMIQRGVGAVSEVISREFYIVTAAGCVCFLCGLLMRREKLDYTDNNVLDTS